MVGLVHPDSRDWIIQDQRKDLITLIDLINQAIENIDKENRFVWSLAALQALENGAKYLTEKYGIKKLV